MTNTKKLENKISNSGLKYNFISEKLGISYYTLRKKIDNVTLFNSQEIKTLCELLNIKDHEEMLSIFFDD